MENVSTQFLGNRWLALLWVVGSEGLEKCHVEEDTACRCLSFFVVNSRPFRDPLLSMRWLCLHFLWWLCEVWVFLQLCGLNQTHPHCPWQVVHSTSEMSWLLRLAGWCQTWNQRMCECLGSRAGVWKRQHQQVAQGQPRGRRGPLGNALTEFRSADLKDCSSEWGVRTCKS